MQSRPLLPRHLATLLHPPANRVTSESLNFFLGAYFFVQGKEAVAEA